MPDQEVNQPHITTEAPVTQSLGTEIDNILLDQTGDIRASSTIVPENDSWSAEPDEEYIRDPVKEQIYRAWLQRQLGSIATLQLPEKSVNGILKHFPEWVYRTARTPHEPIRFLARQASSSLLELDPSDNEKSRREVLTGNKSITIRLVGDILGDDILYLMDIDAQIESLDADDSSE